MKNANNLFEKRFEEKRFVNVSVCESNIKAKKGTYYGRVCKMGHLSTKQVLQMAKDRSPHIDIPLVESALQTIADVILDMAGQGYSIDFANLGTFSLSTQGKIDIAGEIADNYDVSEQVKNGVNFAFKFSPSKELKASMKNIKMNLAIKKRQAPLIKEIDDALPERTASFPRSPAVIKVSGNALKIMGDDGRVGVYIEEKSDKSNIPSFMMKKHINKIIKVSLSSFIQNENKTLTFLLDGGLKAGRKYCITIVTQGVSGAKIGKKIRKAQAEFVWKP